MRPHVFFGAVASLLLASAASARADEPTAPSASSFARGPRPADREWYGWQVLLVDGASVVGTPLVAVAASSAGATSAAVLVGLGGYFFGGPMVHAVHGRPGVALGSLALRVGLPVVGGIAGAMFDKCGNTRELCLPAHAALGIVAGALGAIALDAGLLAYEKEAGEEARARDARRSRRTIQLTPAIAPRREGGVDVGVSATF